MTCPLPATSPGEWPVSGTLPAAGTFLLSAPLAKVKGGRREPPVQSRPLPRSEEGAGGRGCLPCLLGSRATRYAGLSTPEPRGFARAGWD